VPKKRDVAVRLREEQEKVERLKDEQRMQVLRDKIRARRPVRRRRG